MGLMVEFCKIKLSAVEEVCCQTLCLKIKFISRFINKTTEYYWGYPQVFWGGHWTNDNGRYFQRSAELV